MRSSSEDFTNLKRELTFLSDTNYNLSESLEN